MQHSRFHLTTTIISLMVLGLIFLNFKASNRKTSIDKQSYTGQLEPVRDTVQTLLDRGEIPSMAIGVIKDGALLWREAFGWADIEAEIEATPATIYGLGSMSKSICATGVMTLVEKGSLKLDDFVNELIAPARLKGYAGNADSVKVWQILNMSAGIPHGWTTYEETALVPENDREKDALLDRFGLVTFPPGKVSHYANYSMGIADRIMERVSGIPLHAYMKEAVFQPLGMKNALVRYDEAGPGQQLAMPHNSRLEKGTLYHFLPYGGGGYWASVDDLLQYALFHLKESPAGQKAILSTENIDRMHRFDQGPSNLFHLGWFNDGVKLISNGNITGYNSCLILVPSERLAVVVLTNVTSRNSIADQIAFRIVDILAPDLTGGMTREKYMQLYEPPYKPTDALKGSWQGQVHVGGKQLSITMQFDTTDTIRVRMGKEPEQVLRDATYSSHFGVLMGNMDSKIPVPEYDGEEAVPTPLTLYLDGDRLVGNATPRFSTPKGNFSYGAYVELRKE
jgi:CubicO group peptidase (beta-lactamase class C family)